jgi:primosomal protein N' (replication factor Y)
MEQVSGRAGRKDLQGKVLIQTTNPEHPVLHWVKAHDYKKLYTKEIEARRDFLYPPFFKLIQFRFKHKIKQVAESAAQTIANALIQSFGNLVNGPADPVIGRVRNMYIVELLLKVKRDSTSVAHAKSVIKAQIALLQSDKQLRSVFVQLDVDPI